jgi:hypothetical protein
MLIALLKRLARIVRWFFIFSDSKSCHTKIPSIRQPFHQEFG